MSQKRIVLTTLFITSVLLPFIHFIQISPPLSSSAFRLPIAPGLNVYVSQGNNDTQHDHVGKASWAFDFIVGQTNFVVTAAQGGTVIGADDSSNIQCSGLNTESAPAQKYLQDCWTYANHVLIADDDGTTAALYMHLLSHSLKVSLNMHVNQGDPLGLAGTTGWSTGVHLHFQVENIPQKTQPPGWWWTQSVPVSFANPEVLAQDANGVPQEGQNFALSGKISVPTQAPDFTQFVGQWKDYGNWLTITSDGKATYIGRTHVFCTDDPRPPCDGGDQGLAGKNMTIMFNRVNGNTAYGVITGGTGDRDANNNIIPVGGSFSVTLVSKDQMLASDGGSFILCADDPNNIACISNT